MIEKCMSINEENQFLECLNNVSVDFQNSNEQEFKKFITLLRRKTMENLTNETL